MRAWTEFDCRIAASLRAVRVTRQSRTSAFASDRRHTAFPLPRLRVSQVAPALGREKELRGFASPHSTWPHCQTRTGLRRSGVAAKILGHFLFSLNHLRAMLEASRRQEGPMNPIEMLRELRAHGGQIRTRGLDDATLERFASDQALAGAINDAREAYTQLRESMAN